MIQPSLTVLVPSFNHVDYIGAALGSLWRQTRLPDQVIVIDDGSTDGSPSVIERALAEAPAGVSCHLRVQPNRGIAATRNSLVEMADTDLVAFLDSDDSYAPTRLSHLTAAWRPGGLFFAGSGVDFINEVGGDLEAGWRATYPQLLTQAMTFPSAGFALLRSNFLITASNYVMSRQLLERLGPFDTSLHICQEWDMGLRALPLVEPHFVPEPLLYYRRHRRNTSRTAGAQIADDITQIYRKTSHWLRTETENKWAPTPRNWPLFFKIFVRLCYSMSGRRLWEHLAAEIPLASCGSSDLSTDMRDRDRAAAQRILAAAREASAREEVAVEALFRGCYEHWARP